MQEYSFKEAIFVSCLNLTIKWLFGALKNQNQPHLYQPNNKPEDASHVLNRF